jgi:transposase InsO family protein
MREMGLLAKTRRKARKTTNSEHDFPRYPNLVQDLDIVRPEQVWVSDGRPFGRLVNISLDMTHHQGWAS